MKFIRAIHVLLLLSIVGCSGNRSTLRGFGEGVVEAMPGHERKTFEVADSQMTGEEEYWLGKAVAAQIFSKFPPSNDGTLTAYVTKIGQTVVGASERPTIYGGYSFQVLKSDGVNALSAPGGFIFVTEGLLKLARNEEDLAAVLAHEVGHIQAKHGIASIEQSHRAKGKSNGDEVLSALTCVQSLQLLAAAFDGAIKDVMNTLLEKGYSKDQEYEADAIAQKILTRAGYSPLGLAEMLTRLHEQKQGQGGLFSTHPAATDRLNALGLPLGATATGVSSVRDARFNRTDRS